MKWIPLILLIAATAHAQSVRDVVVDGNGTVTQPINLWEANAAGIANALGLATVATTGNFTDLQNKPTTLDGYGITGGQISQNTGAAILSITNTGAAAGIYAESNSGGGIYGFSSSGTGISGVSDSSTGIYGYSGSGYGIYGYSDFGHGIYGSSIEGPGIYGYSNSSTGVSAVSNLGVGLAASTNNATGKIATFTQDTEKAAINSDGTLTLNGSTLTLSGNSTLSGNNTGDQTLAGLGGLPLTGGTITGNLTMNGTTSVLEVDGSTLLGDAVGDTLTVSGPIVAEGASSTNATAVANVGTLDGRYSAGQAAVVYDADKLWQLRSFASPPADVVDTQTDNTFWAAAGGGRSVRFDDVAFKFINIPIPIAWRVLGLSAAVTIVMHNNLTSGAATGTAIFSVYHSRRGFTAEYFSSSGTTVETPAATMSHDGTWRIERKTIIVPLNAGSPSGTEIWNTITISRSTETDTLNGAVYVSQIEIYPKF